MTGRPRVLQVLQPEDGGVAEHVLLLVRGLAGRGLHVEVAASERSTIVPELRDAGIATHVVPIERRPGPSDLRAARSLRAIDRRGGFDLVHAHSSKAGAIVRAALPRRGRLVYTPHCFAFVMPDGRAASALYRGVEQALLPRTAALVVVAEWERRLARSQLLGASRRLRLVRNGVRRCPAAAPDPELRAFAGGEPLVGMVAALRPQKDPLALVRAAAETVGRGRVPGRVAIVGNGSLENAVRDEIERLAVGARVRWFPFRPPAARYLLALDAFVLPSRWEALPLAPLEAMACGIPVVATAVGGVPEAVSDGESGLLVEPGDAGALARALERVLRDAGLRSRMGQRGRELAAERFSVDRMVEATEAVYRDLTFRGAGRLTRESTTA